MPVFVVLVQEDAAQVGVPREPDAHEVPDLALVPVGQFEEQIAKGAATSSRSSSRGGNNSRSLLGLSELNGFSTIFFALKVHLWSSGAPFGSSVSTQS